MKKILLIEDDVFLIDIYLTKLEEDGFKVEAVRSGEEALTIMKKEKFSLVLLDLSLPGMDGWQVLEKMRQDKKMKNFKVIILSNTDVEDKIKVSRLNVEKYLIKMNHTPEEIVREIKGILCLSE